MTINQENPVVKFLRHNRFAVLLLGLVSLLFYSAIIEAFAKDSHSLVIRIAVGGILAYLIVAATFAVGSTSKSSRTVVMLAIPTIVLEILDVSTLRDDTQILSHGFGMLFLGYVIVQLLGLVFQSRRVTADTIFASLCAYLLLATFWMYAYSLLELFDEGAFFYSMMSDQPRIMRLGAEPAGIELYYSLVTMTTLGFGDIVPVSPAARSLTSLQAVVGQLYLAVLVARLVGLHVAESVRRRD